MKKPTTLEPRPYGAPMDGHLEASSAEQKVGLRRVYRSPRLQCFGDIRTLTLGGSPGFSDSSVEPQNMLM